jgi:feruloyl esterase
MTTKQHLLPVCVLLAAFSGCSERAAGPKCEDLAHLALPDTTITLARSVAAGAFVPPREFPFPGGAPPKDFIPYTTLPAFCRVAGSIKPVPDSDIRFEVWMPAEGWNGKLVGVGNGGFWGEIMYPRMSEPLTRGYAVASTDTGHEGAVDDPTFAVGHPEKLVDHGYRAIHEMTVKAKAIVAERYGEGARRSYWLGCSTGGRQGLMEAQRFPEDYDGISAGAPANNWVPLMASGTWIVAALEDPSGGIPAEKFPAIQRAAVDACDEKDGVPDRVIGEPAKCDFDPGVLLCNGADGPDCLTSAQVESMRKIYAGPKNPRTGEQVFPGVEPGSELELPAFFRFRIYEKYFRQLVLENPEWDLRTLDYDRDLAAARERHDAILKATDPDLSVFVDRGGKLFLWHGWNDTLITPRNTIHYYEEVLRTMGADRVKDSVRLFMLPGVLHCSGGDGADNVDHLSVLEGWVELGKAPDHVIARKRLDESGERTRPLCPHPQVARYAGTGNVEDDASYRCSDD